jgi:hypothetical protein
MQARSIEINPSIRFVGFTDGSGTKILYEYRRDLNPLLAENELKLYATEAVLRMKTRKDFESKFGKSVYSYSLYEKVKWATIISDLVEGYPILLVSFDIGREQEDVILNKILPLTKKGWA